ncbi:MAG: DNA-binding protein WhiA [Clostridiales bacterium]|nr:DNA-binding protein WhiA [Clostridiales bacterium]
MSFSSEVKEELSRQIPDARHCQIAEIAAILSFCGHIHISENDEFGIEVQTENVSVARKYFTLLKKTFNIEAEIRIRKNTYLKKTNVYRVEVSVHEDAVRILQAGKFLTPDLEIAEDLSTMNRLVVQGDCCKRAFLRGTFLAAGSISDPEKSYHLEIVCAGEERAVQVQFILHEFGLDARIVGRKKNQVVYLKEGSQIVELLGLMEAGISLMKLENIRIRKEISNNVNRKVNCETANISKTVSAAVKQIEDIRYIETHMGFSQLNEGLEEMAVLRLQYQDATLKELGEMLNPPVGKSGVNHRLRKLSRIAEELRGNKEDYYD